MWHTSRIADTDGNTMQLSVYAETLGMGGTWRSLPKGMIKHNSGSICQPKRSGTTDTNVWLLAGGLAGIKLDTFISWGTVNDQGTGTVEQPWVIGLEGGERRRLDRPSPAWTPCSWATSWSRSDTIDP
jgi:hypothetical protein